MPHKPTGRPPGRPRHPEPLTPAEQRVLEHIRAGRPNAEIATRLGVSPDAVKYHVSNMLGKLGLESREQLAAWREPSVARRAWSGIMGLGWKVAIVGGAAAAGIVVLAALLALRGGDDEGTTAGDAPDQVTLSLAEVGIGGSSLSGVVSADGRWIAYTLRTPDPVSGGRGDVWLLELATGESRLVSADPSGAPANGDSMWPAISGDGRFVAFESRASNLVSGDTNGDPAQVEARLPDSFLGSMSNLTDATRDRLLSDVGGSDVFVFDQESGLVERVSVSTSGSEGNWGSRRPSISADGNKVAFESLATNLVDADNNFGRGATRPYALGGSDIFVRDRRTGTTTRISVAAIDDEALGSSAEPYISANGRAVAFISDALNFSAGSHAVMKGYLRDGSGETRLISVPLSGSEIPQHSVDTAPRLSSDGNLIAFAAVNYWERRAALYLYERSTSTTLEVWGTTVDTWDHRRYRATMSPNGRYLVFCAPGDGIIDELGTAPSARLMVHDTAARRTTELLPEPGEDLPEIIQISVSDSGDVLLTAGGDAWNEFRLLLGKVP